MIFKIFRYQLLVILFIALFCTGCGYSTIPDNKIHVLATTSIVADIVQQVGGDLVEITILIPKGADPHEFSARPKDAAAIIDADIIFSSGAGLEEFLLPLMESIGVDKKIIEVSDGLDYLYLSDLDESTKMIDPHTWMNPKNIMTWLSNVSDALETFDPDHAIVFHTNALNYGREIEALDDWILSEVEIIPVSSRAIITDHDVLGYFIIEYGFHQTATITESFSTDAAPSAKHLAQIEELIINNEIPAIFVSETSSQMLADQIAHDTGIKVVHLLHASLTDEGGLASTYLDFMRYNVAAIVEALK